MGHRINVQYRYTKMLEKLQSIKNISKEVIDDFKSQYEEIININNDPKVIMERLTLAYNIILSENTEIGNNKKIDTNNINDLVKLLVERLETLPQGGYGETVTLEFKNKCQTIMNKDISDKEIINRIENEEKILEDTYYKNLDIFRRWSNKLISNYNLDDKDLYIKKINNQVSYMLSLSDAQLIDYFNEDSHNKEEEMKRHNLEIKVKVLALEEEKKTNKVNLVNKRLDQLLDGKIPYSKEEIDNITSKVEELDMNSQNLDYHLITVEEYINSTLYYQIFMSSQQEKNN